MRSCISVALWLAFTAFAAAAPPRHPADAALRAVQFIDANEGWCVGDDGVILHTIDGGKQWDRQPSGVTGSLRALHFLTPYTGWVVGREQISAAISAGIILTTTDGGLTWSRIAFNTLPGLSIVKFFDDKNGIAAGECCELYPTGVFVTADGGRTWRPIAGPRQPGWLAGDFADLRTGALGGSWSSLGLLNQSVAGTSEHGNFGGRGVQALKIAGRRAVAVGQGGLLLTSDDAGAKWTYSSSRLYSALPAETLADCDLHGVALLGEHIWIAGRPGSIVLHSGDYGKTWEMQRTGQPLPLHAVHFHDSKTGWAVGELGTIMGTRDGGKTWNAVRRGGMRAAVLVVAPGPTELPLDLVASVGGEDGYRVAALRTFAADPATAPFANANDPQRWCEAVRYAGGSVGESLWHFPLAVDQGRSILDEITARSAGGQKVKPADLLVRQLVLAMRVYQPEVVVVTNDAGGFVHAATLTALELAANPSGIPDQLERFGLSPWVAKKCFSNAAAKARSVQVAGSDAMPHLGDSPHNVGMAASAILGVLDSTRPSIPAYYLYYQRLAGDGSASLMDGITLAPGGTARREFGAIAVEDAKRFEERTKAVRAKRNVETLALAEFSAIGGPDKILGQLESTLKAMPADIAGATAYSIAQGLVRSGQWHLARDAFAFLIERYPAEPCCLDAIRWLVQYSASSEARRRHELGQFRVSTEPDVRPASGTNAGNVKQSSTAPASPRPEVALLGDKSSVRHWYQSALALEPYLTRCGTLVVFDPAVQFGLASARRAMGDPAAARRWYDQFLAATTSPTERLSRTDPWRDAASAETWLSARNSKAPRPAGACRQARTKPYLDGKLDDDCWKDVPLMELQNGVNAPGTEYTAKARFAFDDEFLYVAIECSHPPDRFAPKVEKRDRDMDLSQHDRVSIMLDVDRDFQTYYRFQIDQRGALAEDCWGDATWNPRWFVAVASKESGWSAEIAIPAAELTGDRLTAGKVWACNVVRTIPNRGVQAWSFPAAARPRPEGMGLLIFQDEKK